MKRRLHERKSEHLKALAKQGHISVIADHINAMGHIKWDDGEILASEKTDYHFKIKEIFVLLLYKQHD